MTKRPRVIERPWGRYREYARNEPRTVWIIEMKPGEAGSPQSHQNLDELWIMLTDGGEVQVGEVVSHPKALEEIFIPRGTKHRLKNACPSQIFNPEAFTRPRPMSSEGEVRLRGPTQRV